MFTLSVSSTLTLFSNPVIYHGPHHHFHELFGLYECQYCTALSVEKTNYKIQMPMNTIIQPGMCQINTLQIINSHQL